MKEYYKQLEAFSSFEDVTLTTSFFERYWLSKKELEETWIFIQNQIFYDLSVDVPALVFRNEFKLLPMIGGILFGEVDYRLLQECMKFSGDTEFVVIENYDEANPPHNSGPLLRFKFPVDTTWDELNNGGFISVELFGMPHKNYYVFGNTGNWGKYTASDYENPIDVIGCTSEYINFFKSVFKDYAGDYKKIKDFLPAAYLDNEWC